MRLMAIAIMTVGLCFAAGCGNPAEGGAADGRGGAIPEGATKITPETDLHPPVVQSGEWNDPVPIAGPVNTAGVEDAPVISSDGTDLYFFFTPDASAPAGEQLTDGYTGVWRCQVSGESWTEPQRVKLSDGLSLDAPMALRMDTLWFASIREGNYGEDGDIWKGWEEGEDWEWINAGELLNGEYDIGECCFASTQYPGMEEGMICARSADFGEYGGYDLWRLERLESQWQPPENLGGVVNSSTDDGWPAAHPECDELYITRMSSDLGYPGPSIYRSQLTTAGWSEPIEIVSSYVGDAAVDAAGNLYFTHHYVDSTGSTIETDIYVCSPK